jgi:hypothetical protein
MTNVVFFFIFCFSFFHRVSTLSRARTQVGERASNAQRINPIPARTLRESASKLARLSLAVSVRGDSQTRRARAPPPPPG